MRARRELIIDYLLDLLNQIDQLSGYSADAAGEPVKMRGNPPADRRYILIDDGDSPIDDSPQWKQDYEARFRLICHVTTSDSTGESQVPIDQLLSRAVGDARRALLTDHTCGGAAWDLRPGQDVDAASTLGDSFRARVLEFSVFYRTARFDPFSE